MHLLRDKPPGRFSSACLFRPDSIALVGAESKLGGQVMANLLAGVFKGSIAAVDTPESIAALPSAADLAVFGTPPTPDLLQALAAKGTFAAIVLCAADGLSDPARRAGVRVLGPESFGIAVPGIGLNASRAHLPVPAGRLGLVSQSASLCRTVLDWAQPNGVGFSHIVGIGGRADIGFGLILDWLSRDPGTGAILLDIRQLRDRRAFLSAARAASRLRPVVAIRPGSLVADQSGTAERAFEAALRRAGVLCVTNLDDLLAAAEILARARPVRGEALSIVTNSISTGRMAADAVLRDGLQLASDIVHVEPDDSLRLATLAASAAGAPGVGGVLVVHAPTGEADQAAATALVACRDTMRVPLLVCAMGETTGATCRRSLAEAGMAVFATPEQAVRGFRHLVQDRRNRAAARELPHSTVLTVAPDRDAVRAVFATIRRAGRLTAMQDEALAVLSAYGVPVVPNRAVASPDDAAEAATLLGFPAVVKLRQSVRPDARASGGLALDLHDAAEVTAAARLLAARRASEIGELSLLVQRQAFRWRELRVRVADDATFGPIISFGRGGTTADIVGDVAAELPPLNLALAHGLIGRSRAAATLARFRDNPPVNGFAVAEALVRVSQLIVDFPEIAELDLNPLSVDTDGVVAADAWLRLREPGDTGGGLAITPYPAELSEHWATPDGERLIVRPIRPEDADQHGAFFARLSPQDIRYRFFTAMRELSPEQMARLTQIDYDREMAFVAVRESSGETVGVARLVCEDERSGEFAVIVQADMKGRGVARHLMQRLIDWARGRGLREVVGQVLADNAQMLAFVRHLGFRVQRMPEEPEVVEARLGVG
ncbi:MAG TPA: GNAT family N-acetyltransferase [Acetobacteraceae bacterium]|nr:GNAT family N-acetyltransferase [Acetobacteraceae bacterium]